jgi:hypothetical protein
MMLRNMAQRIAELFGNNPHIAEFLDPAVILDAYEQECEVILQERPQLTALMAGGQLLHGDPINAEPSEHAPITVLVIDKSGASTYRVPDPKTHPTERPGIGRKADEA